MRISIQNLQDELISIYSVLTVESLLFNLRENSIDMKNITFLDAQNYLSSFNMNDSDVQLSNIAGSWWKFLQVMLLI